MRWALLTAAILATAGCGDGQTDYFPLAKGNTWTYTVESEGAGDTETMSVERKTSVGPYSGWLVRGDRGESRLAWSGGVLYASQLADTVYDPPIPLFTRTDREWSGTVQTAGGKEQGTATIKQTKDSLTVAGQRYDTQKCTVDLNTPQGRIQLATWYFSGMGILQQDQRSGPGLTLDRRLTFVSGP